MPYKDPDAKRRNKKERWHRRLEQATVFLGGVCVVCGTSEALDFDHVDPRTKLFGISQGRDSSNAVFWLEVTKCQLLCRPHHLEKSAVDGSRGSFSCGNSHPNAKLRELDVKYIRGLYSLGHSQASIAREFCVSRQVVFSVLNGETWSHVS